MHRSGRKREFWKEKEKNRNMNMMGGKKKRKTWQCNECIGLSGHLCLALVHARYSSHFSYTLSGDLTTLFNQLLWIFNELWGWLRKQKISKLWTVLYLSCIKCLWNDPVPPRRLISIYKNTARKRQKKWAVTYPNTWRPPSYTTCEIRPINPMLPPP